MEACPSRCEKPGTFQGIGSIKLAKNFICLSCNVDFIVPISLKFIFEQLMKLDFDKRYSENITEINRLMESLLQNGLDFVQLCNIQKLETDRTFGIKTHLN